MSGRPRVVFFLGRKRSADCTGSVPAGGSADSSIGGGRGVMAAWKEKQKNTPPKKTKPPTS